MTKDNEEMHKDNHMSARWRYQTHPSGVCRLVDIINTYA